MDILTGLGILGETISRNQSYTDIAHVREETHKANELVQKKNALLKEQNDLLKALALEKGIDIEKIKKEQKEKEHKEFVKALEEREKKKAKELGISVEEYREFKNNKAVGKNANGFSMWWLSLGIICWLVVCFIIFG